MTNACSLTVKGSIPAPNPLSVNPLKRSSNTATASAVVSPIGFPKIGANSRLTGPFVPPSVRLTYTPTAL